MSAQVSAPLLCKCWPKLSCLTVRSSHGKHIFMVRELVRVILGCRRFVRSPSRHWSGLIMTSSSLREVFGRLGPIRAVDRNASGSRELAVLLPVKDRDLNVIAAVRALAACGPSLLQAKRAVEDLIGNGRRELVLQRVASKNSLRHSLREAGIDLRLTTPPVAVDIKAVRTQLQMTQEQFSVAYGLELRSLQNYESGARKPGAAALSYFRAIAEAPDTVRLILTQAGR